MTEESSARPSYRRFWPLIIVGIVILLAGAVVIRQRDASGAPEQPIDFKHSIHAQAEVPCLFCHASPMRSDVAGIPSVQRCAGCHQTIKTESPEVQRVLGYWERAEPIPWQAVNDMPDFVFFSHQPHLGAGINCETCHGEVAQMDAARPVANMDMGWCLSCHLQQPEEKVARLTDCLACHK